MTAVHKTQVCIVGGGPAGMICGLLLAEQGVKVLVLESHPDFQREYRGEVLMPRFLQAVKQVGLADDLLKHPHLKLQGFELYIKNKSVATFGIPDISKEAPYILWMPQPIMLNALYERAQKNPNFDLWFDASATDVIREGGRVVGVRVSKNGEALEVRCDVTVGADGRSSIIRKKGGFELAFADHRFDIIWFTIPRPEGFDDKVRAFFSDRHNYLALPKYPKHVQCGILVEAGAFAKYHAGGIGSLRDEILTAHPMLHEFARNLKDFSPFNVLAARVERVKEWAQDGVVLIGDAAHTCSPAGAVGVSVATATAIVAADVIADAAEQKNFSKAVLGRIQALREKDVEAIQRIQGQAGRIVFTQNPIFKAATKIILILLAKTRIFVKVQRRLMVASAPLPVRRWPANR
jgi:2-polyprenyl-6-methoxyphenol hydroxylase-like FAD-dependent oxidoreductase